VTIFAPSIIFGLYWKKGNRRGAIAGIIAGFVLWFYTLLMPAMLKSGVIEETGFFSYLLNSGILNPHALFGLQGLDKWSHALFWELSANLLLYVGFSIFSKQGREEERQALLFVESYSPRLPSLKGDYSVQQIEEILRQYLGTREAREIVDSFMARHDMRRNSLSRDEFVMLRNEAERVLSGALGSAIATIILEDKLVLTEEERGELSNSIRAMTDTLRLSRQELAVANRNLAYLKEFSENIIESAPLGIVTVDSFLRVRYWNREMEAMTKIKKAEAVDRPLVGLLPWIDRETITQDKQSEDTIQSASSQFFRINVSPFKDPSGGYVVIFEDITEKKEMEEQLLQASKLASLGKLTAGISHEIGNPLASISSLVQEIRSLKMTSGEDLEFTQDSLTIINGHIDRIAKIVRSLGDFARISTKEKRISNAAEILEKTIGLVQFDKRFRNIELITRFDGIPPLVVNPDQIQQVFLNLMLNAIDAMPDGGRLVISMRRAGDMVEMEFTDTGKGIDEAIIDRVFDPFFTTKPLGKGTGLGLSICYGIIREHKGTIAVRSKKGQGASFTVRLPVEA